MLPAPGDRGWARERSHPACKTGGNHSPGLYIWARRRAADNSGAAGACPDMRRGRYSGGCSRRGTDNPAAAGGKAADNAGANHTRRQAGECRPAVRLARGRAGPARGAAVCACGTGSAFAAGASSVRCGALGALTASAFSSASAFGLTAESLLPPFMMISTSSPLRYLVMDLTP